jgi:hypothetical protein
MTKNEFISGWKTHLLFGGGFLAASAFSVMTNMVEGERFFDAAWSAVQEIRPVEIVMLISFWYVCAFYQPKNRRTSSFTTLDLQSNQKEDP